VWFDKLLPTIQRNLQITGSGTIQRRLTLSNTIFLPTAHSPALICFGRQRGWWITCNYPRVLKEKNMEILKEYNLGYLLVKVHTT
jgi:hypothetical protein